VADELQIAPGQVTDSELAVLCDSIKGDPPDILVLCGCRRVTNISCLVQLSTISHLDISGCNLGAKGGSHLASAIKDMRALTSLNVANNHLGEVLWQPGSEAHPGEFWNKSEQKYYKALYLKASMSGQWGLLSLSMPSWGKKTSDSETDMSGIIVLANAIPYMGALAKLDISNNDIEQGEPLQLITELCNTKGVELDNDAKDDAEDDEDDEVEDELIEFTMDIGLTEDCDY
jgi:hypothetical protein